MELQNRPRTVAQLWSAICGRFSKQILKSSLRETGVNSWTASGNVRGQKYPLFSATRKSQNITKNAEQTALCNHMYIKIGLLYLVMMQLHFSYLWSYELHYWYLVLPEKANKVGFGISSGTAGCFLRKLQSRLNMHIKIGNFYF